MLAKQNISLSEAAETIHELLGDEHILQECIAREDFHLHQQAMMDTLNEQGQTIIEQRRNIAEQEQHISELKRENTNLKKKNSAQKQEIADQKQEIDRLKALL